MDYNKIIKEYSEKPIKEQIEMFRKYRAKGIYIGESLDPFSPYTEYWITDKEGKTRARLVVRR